MEKEKTGRRYVKINVEPSEKGIEYSKKEELFWKNAERKAA